MINLLRFILRILKRILIPSTARYIRLSPNLKGKIWFYDRKFKKFFNIKSRGFIDSITADQIYSFNDYDLSFLKRYDQILKKYNEILNSNKIPLIIDCGANIGLSAKFFSEEFPESKIVAIEPDKSNILMAQKNCAAISNIEFLEAAIGSTSGNVQISNSDADPNSFRVDRSSSDYDIKVFQIQDILKKFNDIELFITKIDIEGFEDDLFKRNTEWIDKCYLIIIELHDWMMPNTANSNNFLKSISSFKRDFIYKEENIFSIKND